MEKHPLVIYWPSTKPSIKRCTCVNKQKNSRSRWALVNNITRCPSSSSQLETGCWSENQLADWGLCGPQGPWLSNPSQDAKEVLLWPRKNLGQYSSPSLSPLISHTQQTSPFKNKVWKIYIFIKKCIRSLLKSSLPVNDVSACKCIFVYVQVQLYYGYTTLSYTSCVVAIEKWAFGLPSTKVANFSLLIYIYIYIN